MRKGGVIIMYDPISGSGIIELKQNGCPAIIQRGSLTSDWGSKIPKTGDDVTMDVTKAHNCLVAKNITPFPFPVPACIHPTEGEIEY